MAWNNNNAAHVNTWGVLALLTQHEKKFKAAETLTMADLKFFIKSTSPEMLDLMTTTIAEQIDSFFTDKKDGLSAEYEKKVTSAKAVAALKKCLADGTKKIEELATIADDNYQFIALS